MSALKKHESKNKKPDLAILEDSKEINLIMWWAEKQALVDRACFAPVIPIYSWRVEPSCWWALLMAKSSINTVHWAIAYQAMKQPINIVSSPKPRFQACLVWDLQIKNYNDDDNNKNFKFKKIEK